MFRHTHLLLILTALMVMAGCSSNPIQSKRYYVLSQPQVANVAETKPKFGFSIQIQSTGIDALYNRLQLVHRPSLNEFEYYNSDLWAVKPNKMVSELLLKQFHQSNLFAQTLQDIQTKLPDYVLVSEISAIEELEGTDETFAHLAMRFRLVRQKDGETVLSHQFDRREKMYTPSPRALVETLSDILAFETHKLIVKIDNHFSSVMSQKPSEFNPPQFISTEETLQPPTERSIYPEMESNGSWEALPTREQLAQDEVKMVAGKGALFVPTMTGPTREPVYEIKSANGETQTSQTGTKLLLNPGDYQLTVGSGVGPQRVKMNAHIEEGKTFVVTPLWAGLVVRVVDERSVPFRGSYELIDTVTREVYGTGFGVDEQSGETLKTWIVKPGLYKLIRVGENYRARKNFATVYLEPGKLTLFTLVLDPASENFLGAGVTPLQDEDAVTIGNMRLNTLLGGNFNFQNTNNVSGIENGNTLAFSAFLDNKLTLEEDLHFASIRLELEEGLTRKPNSSSFETDLDELDLDSIYIYRYRSWIGPYIRFNLDTNLFSQSREFDEERTVLIVDRSGNLLDIHSGLDNFDLRKSLSSLSFREGAGVNLTLVKNVQLDLNLRLGVGARQALVKNLFTERSDIALSDIYMDNATITEPYFIVQKLNKSYQKGVESALVGNLRLLHWVVMNTDLQILEPFDDFKDPIISWENSLVVRLGPYASLNYVTKIIRDPDFNSPQEPISRDQQILLRLSYALF